MNEGRPFYHFSVDDVFDSLVDISDRGLSLFEHHIFDRLRSLHDEFDVSVDLYIFLEGEVNGRVRRLDELSERMRTDFESAPWLRLGPHARNYATRPYEQHPDELTESMEAIYRQIDRLAGSAARSRLLRLHYFSECYEIAPYLIENGVESLFLTDKSDISYRLGEPEKAELCATGSLNHEGLLLCRSHPRLERMVDEGWEDERIHASLRQGLADHGFVALFTHEIEFVRPEVMEMARRCISWLASLNAASR